MPEIDANVDAQLHSLLEHWPDPAVVVDDKGQLVAVSQLAAQVLSLDVLPEFGRSAHATLCASARGFQHEHNQCPFHQQEAGSLLSTDWHSSYWCTQAGENISVDIRQTLLKAPFDGLAVWSFVSNEARKHNQAELQKFAALVELSPAPIAEFDTCGQLLFANNALQNVMVDVGFGDGGSSYAFPPAMEVLCSEALQQPPEADGVRVELALDDRFLVWHFHRLEDAEMPEISSILGYAFDVTEQKRAQAELEKSQSDARRDFYAKMIHELRTPLNAIMGFSDLLIKRSADKLTSREQNNLIAIKNAGFQLNELVSDTLDISKIEAGHMSLELSEFCLNDLCDAFLPQIGALAKAKKLAFECDIEAAIYLQSDRQKVRQILINLLSNAIKYTPRGQVTLTVASHNGQLTISVADTGVGIPEDQLDKLFKSYQQIKEASNIGIQGTGLGLALVEELVRMLGGTIGVTSEYQKGSVFTFALPLCRDGLSAETPIH